MEELGDLVLDTLNHDLTFGWFSFTNFAQHLLGPGHWAPDGAWSASSGDSQLSGEDRWGLDTVTGG